MLPAFLTPWCSGDTFKGFIYEGGQAPFAWGTAWLRLTGGTGCVRGTRRLDAGAGMENEVERLIKVHGTWPGC